MLDRRTSRMSPQRCWRVLAVLLSVTPCRAHAGKGLEALLDSMIVGGKRKVREAMGPGEADAVCRAPQVRAWRLNTRGAQDGRGGGYRSGAGRRWRGCLVADAVWVGGAWDPPVAGAQRACGEPGESACLRRTSTLEPWGTRRLRCIPVKPFITCHSTGELSWELYPVFCGLLWRGGGVCLHF